MATGVEKGLIGVITPFLCSLVPGKKHATKPGLKKNKGGRPPVLTFGKGKTVGFWLFHIYENSKILFKQCGFRGGGIHRPHRNSALWWFGGGWSSYSFVPWALPPNMILKKLRYVKSQMPFPDSNPRKYWLNLASRNSVTCYFSPFRPSILYTPVIQHSNGKWTLWRCISY